MLGPVTRIERHVIAPHARPMSRSIACAARLIISGRPWLWSDHVAGLVEAQVEYAAWLDRLPDSFQDSATAEALRMICDLDLSELQAIVPPRGFGRD
jgi:hypothetical protein